MPGFLGGSSSGGGTGGEISFPKEFIDPVTKLRVSEPSNLIDTDFEYGLQPTKWETLELINNTPSFFSKSGDTTIQNISSITTLTGSREITVRTSLDHGLSAGIPINVSGTKSLTADGSYIINSIPNARTFTYLARENQFQTASIEDLYTSIITGEFFQGSQIRISDSGGITTDAQSPSILTVKTDTPHGFGLNSPFYFLNLNSSITLEFDSTNTESKSFDASNSSTAQLFDGSNTTSTKAVDFSNRASSSSTSVASSVTGVDTTNDTITVLHSSEFFQGKSLGTALQYNVTAADGYFAANPRGIVYLKTTDNLGTSSSTFKMSNLPDGDVIDLTSNISGTFQLADLVASFAGSNLDTLNQITVSLVSETPISFDGDNSDSQTFTVSAYSGASGVITFSANTNWQVGQMVFYNATGSAATGLTNNTTYWISSLNAATNQANIASDPSNLANPVVNISGGTGTQTFKSISVSLDREILAVPGHNFQEADMLRYAYPEGGRFTTAETLSDYYYVERVYDGTHISLTRTKGFILDGSTEARAAASAAAIKIVNPSAADGAYWIKPAGSTVAHQTYCNFSVDSGGWVQVMKISSGTLQTNALTGAAAPQSGAGFTFGPHWDGWSWNTDPQFASLFTSANSATFADVDAFSPLFYKLPFNDVMVMTIGSVNNRVGWRHNATIPNMRTVTGASNTSTYGDSWLFPVVAQDDYSWVRSGTSTIAGSRLQTVAGVLTNQTQTPTAFGFKILADRSNAYTASTLNQNMTGGYTTDASGGLTGNGAAMIGIGGTGASAATRWGGGIGFTHATASTPYRAHGHWQGQAPDGRNSGGGGTAPNYRTFTGLAVFVR